MSETETLQLEEAVKTSTITPITTDEKVQEEKKESGENEVSSSSEQQQQPTAESKENKKGKISSITEKVGASGAATAEDATTSPTPAETVARQKTNKKKRHHNRGRRNAGGKKDSWKKLDVEVSFNGNGSGSGGRRRQNHKKKPHDQDSPTSNSKHTSSRSHNRKNHSKYNESAENSSNWRKSNHAARQPQPLTGKQLEKYKIDALKQVEYFFTTDELCRNTFLRKNMDTEGYIPAAIIFNFPSVYQYNVPYQALLETIESKSEMLEVDAPNETFRLKNGEYKKWLFPDPNNKGVFGCPRWIKQPEAELEEGQQEVGGEHQTGDTKEVVKEVVQPVQENDKNQTPELVETDGEST